MMELFRSESEFQLRARSVEGRYWSRLYSSSSEAISAAEDMGMQLPLNAKLLLEHGAHMPGYPPGCKDDTCQVKDAELAKRGFELVASWIPGPQVLKAEILPSL
jgi:hypothetical protein